MRALNLQVYGIDSYPTCLLRECAETLDKPLEMMFMILFEKGFVPMGWKMADGLPVFNSGTALDII